MLFGGDGVTRRRVSVGKRQQVCVAPGVAHAGAEKGMRTSGMKMEFGNSAWTRWHVAKTYLAAP